MELLAVHPLAVVDQILVVGQHMEVVPSRIYMPAVHLMALEWTTCSGQYHPIVLNSSCNVHLVTQQ